MGWMPAARSTFDYILCVGRQERKETRKQAGRYSKSQEEKDTEINAVCTPVKVAIVSVALMAGFMEH